MSIDRIKDYAALVDDMAEARGIDLQEAAMRAQLTPSDISDMVLRCTGCTNPEECKKWLAAQTGAVSDTPEYCRNREEFADLAKLSG